MSVNPSAAFGVTRKSCESYAFATSTAFAVPSVSGSAVRAVISMPFGYGNAIAVFASTPLMMVNGVEEAAAVYYRIGTLFYLDWLREGARKLIGDNHWDRLAVFAIIDDLYGHQRDLTSAVLASAKEAGGTLDAAGAIEAWRSKRTVPVQRIDQLFADLRQVGKIELSMLAVANRALRSVME